MKRPTPEQQHRLYVRGHLTFCECAPHAGWLDASHAVQHLRDAEDRTPGSSNVRWI